MGTLTDADVGGKNLNCGDVLICLKKNFEHFQKMYLFEKFDLLVDCFDFLKEFQDLRDFECCH